jgi:anti-anti-sigma factor
MADIRTERTEGILIIGVEGRLDEFGAVHLQEAMEREFHDDDRSVIVDMENVPYLSSAGIRVFTAWKKRLRERGGIFALSGLQEFPLEVLHMAGYSSSFSIFASRHEAVEACLKGEDRSSLLHEMAYPAVTRDEAVYTIEQGHSRKPAVLSVTGDLGKLLSACLTNSDIRSLRFSDAAYSLGLGALGKNITAAMPLLGEMITLHGSMVWVPTDGNMTPDFFTPVHDTGEVQIFTGFNVALHGPFHDIFTVESRKKDGFTIAELYRSLFSIARERRRPFSGILSVVMWAIVSGVRSSEIRHAPVLENAPLNQKTIMDPENYDEWNATIRDPRYGGDTLVSFGFGIDLSGDLSSFDLRVLGSLYYVHPDNAGEQGEYLHNHGVVFRNIPWEPERDLDRHIKKIVKDGEFVDMRHLLDDTRILHAKCGVSYISAITTNR